MLSVTPNTFSKTRSTPLWYLAYGSNLSSKIFRGRRGIRPLGQKNVLVKGLELTFDLPGLPYFEPRMGNCRLAPGVEDSDVISSGEVKEPWTGVGALIGVAYLVTPEDFDKVLATEGGGLSYKMVAVDALVLGAEGEKGLVKEEHIEAFTLLAPESMTRQSPGQPSLRYLTLIRDGARGKCTIAQLRTYS